MPKDIILPHHMRNKKAKKDDKAVQLRRALERAYMYIHSLEKFVVDHVDPETLGTKDTLYVNELISKHYGVSDVPTDKE